VLDDWRRSSLAATLKAVARRRATRLPELPLAGVVAMGASIVGFAIAGYLAYEHYTSSSSLACPLGGGAVNCLAVTTSSYSEILWFPLPVLGLVFFAVSAVLQAPAAWRSSQPVVFWGRIAWSAAGMGTVVWLLYAELVGVHAICLWCTFVHVLTFVVFVATLVGSSRAPGEHPGSVVAASAPVVGRSSTRRVAQGRSDSRGVAQGRSDSRGVAQGRSDSRGVAQGRSTLDRR
jgi:uncharacterized membrane protein